jgi:hypothetical protein
MTCRAFTLTCSEIMFTAIPAGSTATAATATGVPPWR